MSSKRVVLGVVLGIGLVFSGCESVFGKFVNDRSCEDDSDPQNRDCAQYPLPTTSNLYSVWGSTTGEAWVVGDGGTILRWSGHDWVSEVSGTAATLYSVWGLDSQHVWAVGGPEEPGGDSMILFWDGVRWSRQQSNSKRTLRSVWASGDDVYTVGQNYTVLHSLRMTGSWASVSLQNPKQVDLIGISGESSSNFRIVGDESTVLYFVDGTWTSNVTNYQSPSMQPVNLQSIFVSGKTVWTAGTNSTRGVTFREGSDKMLVTKEISQMSISFPGVWGTASNAWFVGSINSSASFISLDANMNAKPIQTRIKATPDGNISTAYRGIWGINDHELWLVGDRGLIQRRRVAP